MKNSLLILLVGYLALLCNGQVQGQYCNEEWTNFDHNYATSTGSSYRAEGFTAALDNQGNPYLLFTLPEGVRLARLDATTGSTIWEQAILPPSGFGYKPNAIKIANNGDIYVAGYEHNFSSQTFGSGTWLRKYNSAGQLLWTNNRALNLGFVQRFFTTNTLKPTVFLELDPLGNAYLTSTFNVEKFDANGTLAWSSSLPTPGGKPIGTALNPSGELLIGGGGNSGVYAYLFDQNGVLLWQFANTNQYFVPADVAFTASNEARILALVNDSGTSSNDFVLLSLDNTGSLTNAVSIPYPSAQVGHNLAIDAAGNYVISGITSQTTGLPYVNWLVMKITPTGTVLWSDEYDENSDNDEFPSQWEDALSLDEAGNVYVTGYGGPLYSSGSFNVASSVTIKYDAATGERSCVWVDQTNMGTGLVVLPISDGCYVAGFGRRQITRYSSAMQSGVNANLTAFLFGAYGTPTFSRRMRTDLHPYLPVNQPYQGAPWNYSGVESNEQLPLSVVDWVLVEVRSSPEASSAYSRQAALIHNHGQITSPQGASLNFPPSPNPDGSVYFVVYHRNHLPLMNGTAVAENTGGKYQANLSSYGAYGGFAAGIVITTNVLGMLSGDANGDGDVNALDRNDFIVPQTGSSGGYYLGDLNLDGVVNSLDLTSFWLPYSGRFTTVPR